MHEILSFQVLHIMELGEGLSGDAQEARKTHQWFLGHSFLVDDRCQEQRAVWVLWCSQAPSGSQPTVTGIKPGMLGSMPGMHIDHGLWFWELVLSSSSTINF